jgi:hypothetical protein
MMIVVNKMVLLRAKKVGHQQMAAEIRMRNGNGRSGDVTCSVVAAMDTLVHSQPCF